MTIHRSRLWRALLIFALLFSAGTVLAGAARASTAHPYSNPVWWPVSAATTMGCYHGNGPACLNPLQHTDYRMDVIAPDSSSTPVYAMGAGVAHVVVTNWVCGQAAGRGNWLYIDHGNGTYSEYGHLATIYVKTGQLVTPSTELATIGRSGYQPACNDPTLDHVRLLWLDIRHDGAYVHFTNSYTCVAGARQTWPTQMASYPTDDWNNVPAHTAIPASTRTCIAAVPATPRKPVMIALAKAAAGALRATWQPAVAADHVTVVAVQLQKYSASRRSWSDVLTKRPPVNATATTFTGLTLGRYRARVWMANPIGWSAPSNWITTTLS